MPVKRKAIAFTSSSIGLIAFLPIFIATGSPPVSAVSDADHCFNTAYLAWNTDTVPGTGPFTTNSYITSWVVNDCERLLGLTMQQAANVPDSQKHKYMKRGKPESTGFPCQSWIKVGDVKKCL